MKILILSVITPFPIDTGGNAGTFKLINEARKTNDITFFSLPSTEKKINGLKEAWPNVSILTKAEVPQKISAVQKAKNKINQVLRKEGSKNTLQLHNTDLTNFYWEDYLNEVINLIKKNNYDLVQVEYLELLPIINFLPKTIHSVFIMHEIRYRRMQFEYDILATNNSLDLWRIENIKTMEVSLLNKYSKVLTVSEDDLEHLVNAGLEKSKAHYSPSPVKIENTELNIPFNFKKKVIYLGPEEHFPNEDGVKWFLKEIWPSVTSKFPDLKFNIIGKWTEPTKETLSKNKNVEFLGFVENLQDEFEGAILIVPLRIGGGMRMKILEGISWNCPIITTTIGAEGIPIVHQENAFIANSDNDFCEAIEYIINKPEETNLIIKKAKLMAGDKYSLDNCNALRTNIYSNLIAKKELI